MEFCTEHWASHGRGQQKRQIILEIFQKNPQATVAELAIACELSPWQIRRHLSRLRQDGTISA